MDAVSEQVVVKGSETLHWTGARLGAEEVGAEFKSLIQVQFKCTVS